MRLTSLYIDRDAQRIATAMPLHPGLNVVVDPNSDRQLLPEFLRGTLFGSIAVPSNHWPPPSVVPTGWIEASAGGHAFRLSRRSYEHRHPHVVTLDGAGAETVDVRPLRDLDPEIFDVFLCRDWSSGDPLPSMANWLAKMSIDRMRSVRPITRIDSWRDLGGRGKTRSSGTFAQESLSEISEQHEQCAAGIRAAKARRELLKSQLRDFEKRCEGRIDSPAIAARRPSADRLSQLHERLDEIDFHWRAWRDVQQQIQKRRIEIRDRLDRPAESRDDSSGGAVHKSREIVLIVESKLAEIESSVRNQSEQRPGAGPPPSTRWFQEMRESLRSLCQNLEQQHRQADQRTAAAELRQLRTCYSEMEMRIKQLLDRRQSVLEQIHAIDPQVAELALCGDQRFASITQPSADRRALGGHSDRAEIMTPGWPSSADSEFDRWQRESLSQQLAESAERIAFEESRLSQLFHQREELARNWYQHLGTDQDRPACDEHGRAGVSSGVLFAEPTDRSEQILLSASQSLRELTGGQWLRIGWDELDPVLVVTDSRGATLRCDRIDPITRNQIAVCLSFAVAHDTAFRGKEMPLVIGNPADVVGPRYVSALAQLINKSLSHGQQILIVVPRKTDASAFSSLRPQLVELPSGSPFSAIPPALALSDSHAFHERPLSTPSELRTPVEAHSHHGARDPGEPLYRFPIQRTYVRPAGSVELTSSMTPPDRDTAGLDLFTSVRDARVLSILDSTALERVGIATLDQLINANPERLADLLSDPRIGTASVMRWQACCWLLVCISEMTGEEAMVLHECGITSPQQLEEIRGEFLLRKLHAYLTETGREASFHRYNVDRINRWMRSLARTRPMWKQFDGRKDTAHSARNAPRVLAEPETDSAAAPAADRPLAPQKTAPARRQSVTEASRESLRFHLKLTDSIDAAPSIGKRVFQQLNKLGIRSVRDFINRAPAEIADGMENRRITADTVRQWQQQACLACAVPNLRRHDAQILASCGIENADQLARISPEDLWSRVEKFAESKEGIRLIRSAKKPERNEIGDWIRWARHSRGVQAA